MAPDDETWAQIRREYCETFERICDICSAHGITPSQLDRRRRSEGWPARTKGRLRSGNGRWFSAESLLAASPPGIPGPASSSLAETREALVQRLYSTLVLKLVKLEQHMNLGGRKTSIDHERDTRALDGCVRALERITEYTTALASTSSPAATARADASSEQADAVSAARTEQLRREIAQRLERLLEKRGPPGDAGEART